MTAPVHGPECNPKMTDFRLVAMEGRAERYEETVATIAKDMESVRTDIAIMKAKLSTALWMARGVGAFVGTAVMLCVEWFRK